MTRRPKYRGGIDLAQKVDISIDRSKPPKALDSIVDVVLAYRPKAKSKPARRRKRLATKIAKAEP